MTPQEMQQVVINALEDLKGQDILVLDVTNLTDITDKMVFCSGTSTRHVKSLAQNVVTQSKKNGMEIVGVEGELDAEWVLVDLGDIVLHVMLPNVREFYQIEKLWDMKPDDSLQTGS